ncbi:MAG: phosphate/phosphite/phosphonate ABC transporter substrate-binding protein [Sulfolobales archaeon]
MRGLSRISVIIVVVILVIVAIGAGYTYLSKTPSSSGMGKMVVVVNPIPRERVEAEARELESFLESRLGLDVELYFPTSVAAIVESLRFGHAQLALGVGSLPAALAIYVADVEMLLVEVRDVVIGNESRAAPYYYSYWIVAKDSPYKGLEDLKGKRACFPNELSTSGYIFPMYRLVQLGYIKPPADPKQFFGEVVFAGGYAQCWEALKRGHVDVTIMAGDVPVSLYWEAINNSRVLEQQGPIPAHVVLVSKSVPKDLRDRIKNALLELNNKPDLMRKFVSAIFVRFEEKGVEEHLKPLMNALETTGLKDKYLRAGS